MQSYYLIFHCLDWIPIHVTNLDSIEENLEFCQDIWNTSLLVKLSTANNIKTYPYPGSLFIHSRKALNFCHLVELLTITKSAGCGITCSLFSYEYASLKTNMFNGNLFSWWHTGLEPNSEVLYFVPTAWSCLSSVLQCAIYIPCGNLIISLSLDETAIFQICQHRYAKFQG